MNPEVVYVIAVTVVGAFMGTFGFLIGQLTEASSRRDWVIRHRSRP